MQRTARDGDMSWRETLGLPITLLRLPLVLIFRLLTSPWSVHKTKTWKRVISDVFSRFTSSQLSVRQLQYSIGPTLVTYKAWARQRRLDPVIEEIGDGARLMWLGPKRTDRVVLYFHGGGYLLPMQGFSLPFLRYLQLQLQGRSINVGIAALNYSLAPNAPFPTQMRQATAALNYLIKEGVDPARIQLVGDSAGANLILQLFSHLLHPHPSIPPVPELSKPIKGAFLLSPMLALDGGAPSFKTNDKKDVLSKKTLTEWCSFVRAGVPDDQLAYAAPVRAPAGWWSSLGKVVDRVLITAGDAECFESDIAAFTKVLRGHLEEWQLTSLVQKDGVHDDPLLDFLVGESKLGSLTPLIVDWFAEGFNQ